MNPQGNPQQGGGFYPYQPNPQITMAMNAGATGTGTYPVQQFPIPAGAPVVHYGYGMPIPHGLPPNTVSSSSSGNHGRNNTSCSPDPSKDWNPTQKDRAQLDKWFFEIDKGGSGFIGGSQAVEFLKHSNLSRDTLRAIWSLVDSNNAGRIDLYQVSIAYVSIIDIVPLLIYYTCSPLNHSSIKLFV